MKWRMCRFTDKVASRLETDLVIIYDHQVETNVGKVFMKNDGYVVGQNPFHAHATKLKTIEKDCDLPVVKAEFEVEQREMSKVILWLDANNILAD